MDFKRARKDAGLTLAKLAEASGYAIGTISDLERTGEGGKHLKEKLTEVLTGQKPPTPVAIRESSPEYLVDDLITEIESLKVQLRAVERAAKKLQRHEPSSSPAAESALNQVVAERVGKLHKPGAAAHPPRDEPLQGRIHRPK